MTTLSKVRTGYGLNLHEQNVWCDDPDNLRCLISRCSKDFQNKFWEAVESAESVADMLEGFNPDCPLMALATILAEAVYEGYNIRLTADIDFADSDVVILAMPDDDPQRLSYSNDYLKNALSYFTDMLSWRNRYQPEYVSWHEEVKYERQFEVITPIGKLRIRAKSEDDANEEYPGVYVDFIAHNSNEEVSLACVEYSPSDDTIAIDVNYDEKNVERFYRKDLPGAMLATAKNYIKDFLHREYGSDAEEDFHDLSRVPIAWGCPDEQEQVEVNVYADLENFYFHTYLTAPEQNAVLVSTNSYSSLEELVYNELDSLDYDSLVTILHEEWVAFSANTGTQVWLRGAFPVGATRHFDGFNTDYDGTIKGQTDSGRIIVEQSDGTIVDLLFCGDLFTEVQ